MGKSKKDALGVMDSIASLVQSAKKGKRGPEKSALSKASKKARSVEKDSSRKPCDVDKTKTKPKRALPTKVKPTVETDSSDSDSEEVENVKHVKKSSNAVAKKQESSSDISLDSEDEPVKPLAKAQAKGASRPATLVTGPKHGMPKIYAKAQATHKPKPKEESSSEDDHLKHISKPPSTAKMMVNSKNRKKQPKKQERSSESSSEDESSGKVQPTKRTVISKSETIPMKKMHVSSSDDSSESNSEDEKQTLNKGKPLPKPAIKAVKSAQPALKKNTARVPVIKPVKEDESSDEDGSSESDEESSEEDSSGSDEEPVKLKAAQVAKLSKKAVSTPGKSVIKDESSEEEPVKTKAAQVTKLPKDESSDESSDEEPEEEIKTKAKVVKLTTKKKESNDKDESSEESDDESEEEKPKPVGNVLSRPLLKKAESSDEEESSGESSDESEDEKQKHKLVLTAAAKPSINKDTSSDEESSQESEDESDEEPQKKRAKLEVSTTAKAGAKAIPNGSGDEDDEGEEEDEQPKSAKPGKAQLDNEMKVSMPSGGRTVFVKNLAWSVDEDLVQEFFEKCGEVKEVRLARDQDGQFKGYGHVEFTSESAAKKALKLSKENFAGREIYVDLAWDRAFSPGSTGKSDFRTPRGGGFSQRLGSDATAFVKGFDKYQDENTIRNSLKEFFGVCKVQGIRIPTDRETGDIKGFAYVEFEDKHGLAKAVELNGSDMNGRWIVVEEAGSGPPGSGGRGGRGGDLGGRGGFRGRGRGGFGGGRGGQGRGGRGGRGTPREKVNLVGSGKKTTYGEE